MSKLDEPIVDQPDVSMQREYKSLENDNATRVKLPNTNKVYKIKWLKYGQLDKLTKVLLDKKKYDDGDVLSESRIDDISRDGKVACKAAAIYILNGFWKLHLLYWFLWRWFYYIKQYDNLQLYPLLEAGKKKVPLMQFYATTTLLIGVRDTLTQMTMMEAERILQGLNSEHLSGEQST